MNQMGEVLPGLFVGSVQDAIDKQHLNRYGITHIISIMDNPERELTSKTYLCVKAFNKPDQNLYQFFSATNDFIHEARSKNGSVLIHCLGGVSRSVTLATAYIMTMTNLTWLDALNVIRAERCIAHPNIGFLHQLEEFEKNRLNVERYRLGYKFPNYKPNQTDSEWCKRALEIYYLLYNANPNLFEPIPPLFGKPSIRFGRNRQDSKYLSYHMKKWQQYGLWDKKVSKHDKLGQKIMENVWFYKSVPKKDRATLGKFVDPLDNVDPDSVFFDSDDEDVVNEDV